MSKIVENCGSCHNARPMMDLATGNVDLTKKECCAEPPKAVAVPTPQGVAFITPQIMVPNNKWCGSWKAKPVELNF